MPDVSIFKLGSQTINVKDSVARSLAQSSNSTATEAKNAADQALDKATEIENLSRVTVEYDQASETITITTGTHSS